jgi:hypothetical protein
LEKSTFSLRIFRPCSHRWVIPPSCGKRRARSSFQTGLARSISLTHGAVRRWRAGCAKPTTQPGAQWAAKLRQKRKTRSRSGACSSARR